MQIAELERRAGLWITKCLHTANVLVRTESRLIGTAHGIGGYLIDGVSDMLLETARSSVSASPPRLAAADRVWRSSY